MAKASPGDGFDWVIFQGSHQLGGSELERAGLRDLGDRRFGRKLEDIKGDWQRVCHQIAEWIDATQSDHSQDYELDKVTVALGFNAKGELVFDAEGGVQTTVTVTLKRRD